MISVLLVDDEETLLDLTKIFLERESDIRVTPIISAFDALTSMESQSFDAVVSDYEMPLMNGIDFLKALKARGDDTPFIIFTGRGREVVAIDALNSGATFYLHRGGDVPVQYAELRNMILQAVQRRHSEQALLTSEERYRAVVESQMELICRFRPDGRLLFVNGAFCRYYGKTMDELVGHRYTPALLPEDRALIRSHLSSLTMENPRSTLEHRIVCPRLGVRWQQWTDTAVFGERGEVMEYQSVGRDITDRILTEEELKNTLSLIAATLESTDNGILVFGPEGQLITANKLFSEMWNVPDTLLGAGSERQLLDHMRAQVADPEAFLARIREFARAPDDGGFDRIAFRDGRVLERNSKPMFVAGHPKGRVWSFLDITERVRAERVLKEANKKLHLLNTITRHDVLNQLTAISTLLQLARQRDTGPEVNDMLARAEKSVDTIEHQIIFMSDYQDIDIQTPRWQSLRGILRKVEHTIPVGTIQMEINLDNIEVFADPLLEKVFFNLVDNALRHGGGITRMVFYSRKDDDELRVFCGDNGKGIAPEEKERIFNLGYGRHTGFGLYLAREILSITGISVDEVGEAGTGALFRMTIPQESYRIIPETGS